MLQGYMLQQYSHKGENITVNANTPSLKPFLDMMIEEMKKDTADTVKNSRDSQQDNLF